MTEVKTPVADEKATDEVIVKASEPSEEIESSPTEDENSFAEEILGIPEVEPTPEKVEEKEEEPEKEIEPQKEEQEKVESEPEKPEEKQEEKEVKQPEIFTPTEATGLDKRIAKLYLNNQLLNGADPDYTLEQVIDEVKKHPFEEKKSTLHRLLSESKQLKGQEDDGRLTQEDVEALADAEADRRVNAMLREREEKAWQQDLIETVEAHPELDERSKKFDKNFSALIEARVQNGMKASDAYNSVIAEKEAIKQIAQKEIERERQKDLSGTMSANAPQEGTDDKKKSKADKFAEEILGF